MQAASKLTPVPASASPNNEDAMCLFMEPRWYAVHTSSRHENRVYDQLRGRGVEAFVPSYSSVRVWKDRRVKLELPRFPSYLFVRIALTDRLVVLKVPGVVRIVGSLKNPTPVPDLQIHALQLAALAGWPIHPHPFLQVGMEVRIKSGPFEHLTGILVRKRGITRVVISIVAIAQSFAVELDAAAVAPVSCSNLLAIA